MLISIVIPHLNQSEYLAICLASLHNQLGVSAEIEIIVVDNGSKEMPESVCSMWPDVHLMSEKQPGPGPARNRGASLAKGDFLAFIDADCRAHPSWLAAIESAFANSEINIVGGDVQVGYEDIEKPTFLEPYENIYGYRNSEYIAKGFAGTGNLAIRSVVLVKVGPFAGIEVAEDRDWGHRAGACGYEIRYLPEMIVYHPARKSFAELASKWDRQIAHDYENVAKTPLGNFLWLARALAVAGSPVFEIARILRSDRVRTPYERLLAILCLVRIRAYRGWVMCSIAFRQNGHKISGAWNR